MAANQSDIIEEERVVDESVFLAGRCGRSWGATVWVAKRRPAILIGFGLVACLVVIWLLAGMFGFFSQTNPELVEVGGVVILDGLPLPNATITFKPTSGERGSYGVTDKNGRYFLKYSQKSDGARVGEHVVTISTGKLRKITVQAEDVVTKASERRGSNKKSHLVVGDEKVEAYGELVPPEYNVNSVLRFDAQGSNLDCDWELKTN